MFRFMVPDNRTVSYLIFDIKHIKTTLSKHTNIYDYEQDIENKGHLAHKFFHVLGRLAQNEFQGFFNIVYGV